MILLAAIFSVIAALASTPVYKYSQRLDAIAEKGDWEKITPVFVRVFYDIDPPWWGTIFVLFVKCIVGIFALIFPFWLLYPIAIAHDWAQPTEELLRYYSWDGYYGVVYIVGWVCTVGQFAYWIGHTSGRKLGKHECEREQAAIKQRSASRRAEERALLAINEEGHKPAKWGSLKEGSIIYFHDGTPSLGYVSHFGQHVDRVFVVFQQMEYGRATLTMPSGVTRERIKCATLPFSARMVDQFLSQQNDKIMDQYGHHVEYPPPPKVDEQDEQDDFEIKPLS